MAMEILWDRKKVDLFSPVTSLILRPMSLTSFAYDDHVKTSLARLVKFQNYFRAFQRLKNIFVRLGVPMYYILSMYFKCMYLWFYTCTIIFCKTISNRMGVDFATCVLHIIMLMKWKANQKLQTEGKQHQQLSLTFKSTLMFTNRYLGTTHDT